MEETWRDIGNQVTTGDLPQPIDTMMFISQLTIQKENEIDLDELLDIEDDNERKIFLQVGQYLASC